MRFVKPSEHHTSTPRSACIPLAGDFRHKNKVVELRTACRILIKKLDPEMRADTVETQALHELETIVNGVSKPPVPPAKAHAVVGIMALCDNTQLGSALELIASGGLTSCGMHAMAWQLTKV